MKSRENGCDTVKNIGFLLLFISVSELTFLCGEWRGVGEQERKNVKDVGGYFTEYNERELLLVPFLFLFIFFISWEFLCVRRHNRQNRLQNKKGKSTKSIKQCTRFRFTRKKPLRFIIINPDIIQLNQIAHILMLLSNL